MIFADKLIQLRKKSGWSQEELAEQLNVTRQSVSKWEGAQSIPDYEKLIRLSELFGVSLDYLLKDNVEEAEFADPMDKEPAIRRVSMEEANKFLSVRETASKSISFGVFLCILSPICLFILGAMSEIPEYGIGENVAAGAGVIVLLILIAAAVANFIACGSSAAPFEYLEKEIFETEYGVSGMVKARKEAYKNTYTRGNIMGSCLCIGSLIPLFCGLIINEENDLLLAVMLSGTFVLAGIGVMFFVRSGIIWASYEKLLQEGDYSRRKKEKQPVFSAVSGAYWAIVTALFLIYSFATNNWDYSWIIWAVAGVLYGAIFAILNAFDLKK